MSDREVDLSRALAAANRAAREANAKVEALQAELERQKVAVDHFSAETFKGDEENKALLLRLDAGIAMAEQLVDSEHGDAAGVALRILEVLQPSAVERHDPLAEKERQRDKLRDDMSGITDVMLGVERRTPVRVELGDADEKCGICGAKWNEWHDPVVHKSE